MTLRTPVTLELVDLVYSTVQLTSHRVFVSDPLQLSAAVVLFSYVSRQHMNPVRFVRLTSQIMD